MAEALGLAVNCLSIVDISAKIGVLLFEYGRAVSDAREDIECLREQIDRLGHVAGSVEALLQQHGRSYDARTVQVLRDSVLGSEADLRSVWSKLDKGTKKNPMRRLGLRALKWPFESRDVNLTISRLRGCYENLSWILQLNQTSMLHDLDRRILLDSIPHASDAAFDSRIEANNPQCHPKTRHSILTEISQWSTDPWAKNIFWLNGMAGTGKSTISRTVAAQFSSTRSLAASFFFKRGERNRGDCTRFFGTIAFQLAARHADYALEVQKNIDADPDLVNRPLRDQFQKLIQEPLAAMAPQSRTCGSFVIVIDALDECDDDDDIRLLINLFSKAHWDPSPWRLKTFITSRPELPIRLGFGAVRGTFQDLILHEVANEVVRHDLQAYLEDELHRIKLNYNLSVPEHRQLGADWPSQSNIELLAATAAPLFIFAATVCRFVADRKSGSPRTQLQKFLSYRNREQASKLEAIYLPILNETIAGLSEAEQVEVLKDFQLIVGTIILLATPLSARQLANFLDVPLLHIGDRLDMLHSVLNVPSSPDKTVRPLHLSLRDFLTEPQLNGKNPFWVDSKRKHRSIADKCLHTMQQYLKHNMCGLGYSAFKHDSDTQDLVSARIPHELRYACLWWIHHFEEAEEPIGDEHPVHSFLKQHLLHWVEVVYLLGTGMDLLGALKSLLALVKPPSELRDFISESIRVIRANLATIDKYPLQVYTMLAFWSPQSIVRKTFEHYVPSWIDFKTETAADDDENLVSFVYPDHYGPIQSVEFSPDDRYILTISMLGNINLWDIDSGFHRHSIECAGSSKISFSHDGQFFAANGAGEVKIFSTASGHLVQEVPTYGCWAFSQDSPQLAVTLDLGQIAIWRVGSGPEGSMFQFERMLQLFGVLLDSIVFSDNKLTSVSRYTDHQVEVWSTSLEKAHESDPHRRLQVISWPESLFRNKYGQSILSPDSSFLAFITPGLTLSYRVEIFMVATGRLAQVFESDYYLTATVKFSPASGKIARDSGLGTINVRESGSGRTTYNVRHRELTAAAFAHRSELIAVAGYGLVQVRAMHTTSRSSGVAMRFGSIVWVECAPDSSLVAAGISNGDVEIWNPATGECERVLRGHARRARVHVFSDDSQVLATCCEAEYRLWSMTTGQCIHLKQVDSEWYHKLRGPKGERMRLRLVKGLPDVGVIGNIRLDQYYIGESYNLVVGEFDFIPETGHLAFNSHPGVHAWHWSQGRWAHILADSVDSDTCFKISRDGGFLVGVNGRTTAVRVWELKTGQRLFNGMIIDGGALQKIYGIVHVAQSLPGLSECPYPSFEISFARFNGSGEAGEWMLYTCPCQTDQAPATAAAQGVAASVVHRQQVSTKRVKLKSLQDGDMIYTNLMPQDHFKEYLWRWGERFCLRMPPAARPKRAPQSQTTYDTTPLLAAMAMSSDRMVFIRMNPDAPELRKALLQAR